MKTEENAPLEGLLEKVAGGIDGILTRNFGPEVELRLLLREKQVRGLLDLIKRLDEDFFDKYLPDDTSGAFEGLWALRGLLYDHVHADQIDAMMESVKDI